MRLATLFTAASLLVASSAHAEAPQWFGFARAGVSVSDAQRSWREGGLGRYLADDDDALVDLDTQLGMLWEPTPDWRVFVQALARGESAGSGRHAGLVEAYVDRDFFFSNDSRLRFRVGEFFLPTSREAVDPLWQSRYSLGLSTLNSWIAEEFRPIGLDASWRNPVESAHEWEIAATAVTGNDSAGALLSWRGFAQHDRISVLGEVLGLPDLPTLATGGAFGHQRDDGSKPFGRDLDGRIGYALRARYGDPARFRVLATRVDTRGDRELHRGEYAWRTRFSIIGGEWQLDDRWTLAGEWLDGDSGMGLRSAGHVDIDFTSAYLLASYAPDDQWRFSARVEQFDIRDRDGLAENNDDEGDAWTLAALRDFGEQWRAGIEWTHGDSAHAAAAMLALPSETSGDQWRLELRRSF